MVKYNRVKEVIEDAEIYGQDFTKSFGHGYEDFEFPFTLSFYKHRKYEVEIIGKKATVKKIG